MELSPEESRKKNPANLPQNPFQFTRFTKTSDSQTINRLFSQFSKEELIKKNEAVSIAGRMTGKRMFFADLTDQTGTIQLKFNSKNEDLTKLDNGSIIGVKGIICRTDKGQLSVEVKEFVLLSRCLRLIPSSYYGFSDTEERFRNRPLDFIINRQKKEIFLTRHQVIKNIRQFLEEKSFIEIETPILVSEASGAQAKPFITHHNKLHRDFYLRIATEIPLKKLLVGGFEKIYEIGRIFRNEGIDARHNPEFTTVEVYQAYENAEYMMNLTEELFHYLAEKVFRQQTEFTFNSHNVSLQKPFRRLSMIEAIREHTNIDFAKINGLEEAHQLAQKYNLKLEKFQKTTGHVILAFFEEYVEQKLIQPTFIYDYPVEVSPLAKSKSENEKIADRFELYLGGLEFANGYSELNDPTEQKKRFEEQTKQKELGNEEIASFDKEFLEALEYGMPPAGGLGIGIDRLIMLFTEQNSIKEVIVFPQLKKKFTSTIANFIENREIEEEDERLVTIFLFLSTFLEFSKYLEADFVKEADLAWAEDKILRILFNNTLLPNKKMKLEMVSLGNSRIKFSDQKDNEDYFFILGGLLTGKEQNKPRSKSIKREISNLQRVRTHFAKNFLPFLEEEKRIEFLAVILDKLSFIEINLIKEEDIVDLFVALNETGLNLSQPDLIR
ncbi:13527_t:CDS:2, partial [Cetraspora pellucida]